MIATLTNDPLTGLEKQYISRVNKLLILINELKKSRLHFVALLQKSTNNNSVTYSSLVKERIGFIVQLQNQINKHPKKIQEIAIKSHFEKDVFKSNYTDFLNEEEAFFNHEKKMLKTYLDFINEVPLSSDLELLLCKQLNAIEYMIG